jgi:hypothetical protein
MKNKRTPHIDGYMSLPEACAYLYRRGVVMTPYHVSRAILPRPPDIGGTSGRASYWLMDRAMPALDRARRKYKTKAKRPDQYQDAVRIEEDSGPTIEEYRAWVRRQKRIQKKIEAQLRDITNAARPVWTGAQQ